MLEAIKTVQFEAIKYVLKYACTIITAYALDQGPKSTAPTLLTLHFTELCTLVVKL